MDLQYPCYISVDVLKHLDELAPLVENGQETVEYNGELVRIKKDKGRHPGRCVVNGTKTRTVLISLGKIKPKNTQEDSITTAGHELHDHLLNPEKPAKQ